MLKIDRLMSRTITLSRPCRRFVHHKNLVHEIIRPQLLRFTALVLPMRQINQQTNTVAYHSVVCSHLRNDYTASIGTLNSTIPYHTSVVCTVILVVCVLLGNWLDDARSWWWCVLGNSVHVVLQPWCLRVAVRRGPLRQSAGMLCWQKYFIIWRFT